MLSVKSSEGNKGNKRDNEAQRMSVQQDARAERFTTKKALPSASRMAGLTPSAVTN
jgi:hypothetical protein